MQSRRASAPRPPAGRDRRDSLPGTVVATPQSFNNNRMGLPLTTNDTAANHLVLIVDRHKSSRPANARPSGRQPKVPQGRTLPDHHHSRTRVRNHGRRSSGYLRHLKTQPENGFPFQGGQLLSNDTELF
ncbi:hypothetical protein D0C37_30470 [Streptomyces koyangensis]|uniref:Uncharacterized protein n=1 Tax=Streptomyces koyangensis TaxID=188770 RepID=A0A385DLF8_9ACTN|nr:hypothetical protein D0C37_30470 [Streptomyces koyangensis]